MIGIDLVKPDGRNGQFLHTLDNAMDDLRAQIESLRLPKIEMETKLGQLHAAVQAKPTLEILEQELEELAETRRRKEHLFKTDTSMLGALEGLVRAIKEHKAKERVYQLRVKNHEGYERSRMDLSELQLKQAHLWQRLDGLAAVRQRIVSEQNVRMCAGAHIISARPGGSRCAVRCVSAPLRRPSAFAPQVNTTSVGPWVGGHVALSEEGKCGGREERTRSPSPRSSALDSYCVPDAAPYKVRKSDSNKHTACDA
jgi:hypothetical protein